VQLFWKNTRNTREQKHVLPVVYCCSWCVCVCVCVWSQAKCLISHTTDLRGTVNDNSWSGRCLEPDDQCPADANNECVPDASLTLRTCYKCNIPPTCEGQLSSPSLCKQHVVLFHWLLLYFVMLLVVWCTDKLLMKRLFVYDIPSRKHWRTSSR